MAKSGSNAKIDSEGQVWETGDKISFNDGVLSVLSIVGLDSRNHPALLYMGTSAAVLPVGDMVPDEWTEEGETTPDNPVVIPTPEPIGNADTVFHTNQDELKFGNENLLVENNNKVQLSSTINYPKPDKGTKVTFTMKNNDNKLTMFKVTVYKPDGTTIFDPEWKEVKKGSGGDCYD